MFLMLFNQVYFLVCESAAPRIRLLRQRVSVLSGHQNQRRGGLLKKQISGSYPQSF